MTKCVNELNMILFFSFSSPSLKSGGIVITHRVLSCPVLSCPTLPCSPFSTLDHLLTQRAGVLAL